MARTKKPETVRLMCEVAGIESQEFDFQHALNILRIESKKRRAPQWQLHPKSGFDFVNNELVKSENSKSTGGESSPVTDK